MFNLNEIKRYEQDDLVNNKTFTLQLSRGIWLVALLACSSHLKKMLHNEKMVLLFPLFSKAASHCSTFNSWNRNK